MKPRLLHSLLHVTAALILVALISSCSSYGPSFDPYAKSSNLDKPSFESVQASKFPSSWLKPSQEPYRLGPGDELLIEIIGIAGSASTTFVTPDGKLYYQNLTGARVRGMTLPELKQLLEKDLAKWYHSPNVSVSLSAVRSQRIWVLGRVVAPGVYPINRPTTVLEAISTAGGLSVASTTSLSSTGRTTAELTTDTQEVADLRRAFLIRDGKYVPVNFQALIRGGDMTNNIFVKDGDYIFLPSSASKEVFVMGSVTTPRSIRFNEELSLVAAIAAAGGPTKYAHVQNIVIIRGSLTEPRVAVVPYRDIITGEARNVALEPHDIVWVPKSPWERIDKLVNEVLGTYVRTVAVNEGARIAAPAAGTVGTSIDVGGTALSVTPP